MFKEMPILSKKAGTGVPLNRTTEFFGTELLLVEGLAGSKLDLETDI